ncbi:MAG: DNA double-strand break repair nuclease NurA [Chloroflexi bacterium]|nr:DNA double-strand break repair nuclease NurA [Chloroflexota bacterium]
MSLDLTQTAIQIDRMAQELRSRDAGRRSRIERAVETLLRFDAEEYAEKLQSSRQTLAWRLPGVPEDPAARHAAPAAPDDFCVVATDGSHIDVDRHLPARCFLINIGVSVLTYGSSSDARLFNEPRLYAAEDDLVIRDRLSPQREQVIEGAVLGARRTVEEIAALVRAARDLPEDIPALALMDGSLIMYDLLGFGNRQFVLRELIEEGFVAALDELRRLAGQRRFAVASYISLPRGAEVVNALRLRTCPFDVAECERHCGQLRPGRRPCDEGAWGIYDRELFAETLAPGERSAVFVSSSSLVADYYQGHDVHFFYLHAGEEIGRVEIPSWVAEDEALLGLTHALILDQCRRGPGYPIALMEAHEQAVVTGPDRRFFVEQVENTLSGQRLPVYSSEKSRSKRLRWL